MTQIERIKSRLGIKGNWEPSKVQGIRSDIAELSALHVKVKGNPVLDRLLREALTNLENKIVVVWEEEAESRRREELIDRDGAEWHMDDNGEWKE